MHRITLRRAMAARLRRILLLLPFLPFLPLALGGLLLASRTFAQSSPWPLYRPDPGAIVPPPQMAAQMAGSPEGPRGPESTGGTWKVLILIYRNMDVTYGTSRWKTNMTDAQVAMLQSACANYDSIASTWSAGRGNIDRTVRVVTRPLASLTPVFGSYFWVTPDDVAPELDPELAVANYDSVVVLWEPGPAPTNYWGLAYVGPIGRNGHPFTWATVIKGQDWWWSMNDAPGEVILHEWLHGLEGHYRNQSYVVPELHGAEEHGYKEDSVGGWRTWLNDYLQGKVLEPGRTTGISPAVWASGAVNNPVRPAPVQLLGPLNGTSAGTPPTLAWAGPDASFRLRLTNMADDSPAYETVTAAGSATPAQHVLRTDNQYRWQVVAKSGAVESSPVESMAFRYTGACIAYSISQATQALQIAAGIGPAGVNTMGRLNLETSGPSAGRVDEIDAIRLVRKVAGLEPNP